MSETCFASCDFYRPDELSKLGLGWCDPSAQIDRSVRFIRPDRISIGPLCRIDYGALLSAGDDRITIERNVHIGAQTLMFGGGGQILLSEFSGVSSAVRIYTASDSYTGGWLAGPTVPEQFRRVERGSVVLERFALVGTGAVLLPGILMQEGSACGANSVVSSGVPRGALVAGHPARIVIYRDVEQLRRLRQEYLQSIGEWYDTSLGEPHEAERADSDSGQLGEAAAVAGADPGAAPADASAGGLGLEQRA